MELLPSLLQPFYGYLHLGMHAEANDELESLPNEMKAHPLVLLGRLELLMEMQRWEDGIILGQSLCKLCRRSTSSGSRPHNAVGNLDEAKVLLKRCFEKDKR
jgi:hypothetical protein